MPPALDTPEEVAAIVAAVLAVLGVAGAGVVGVVAAIVAAWNSKVRPLLADTQNAAHVAAHELRNNSGGSTRDAVDRIETVARELRGDVRDLRHELSDDRTAGNRTHSELFRRLHALESPIQEDTLR